MGTDARHAYAEGMAHLRGGRATVALPLLRDAFLAAPDQPARLHALASAMQSTGRAADAARLYRDAGADRARDPALLAAYGRACLLAAEREEGVRALRAALSLDPRRTDAATLLAGALRDEARAEEACDLLAPLAAGDADPELVWMYANCLWDADRIRAATAMYERYAALRPDSARARVALGRFATARGDLASAQRHFADALVQHRDDAALWWELHNARREPLATDERAQVERLAAASTRPGASVLLEDVLARDHDRRGEWAEAAERTVRANAAHRRLRAGRGLRYDPARHTAEVDALIAFFDRRLMARLAGAGDDTTAPVFVFGLPRSGTTLTERLLDAHPDVAGIGEPPLALRTMQRALSACQAQPDGLTTDLIREAARWHAAAAIARQTELAPDKPHARRVESQPDNYLQAGWLALAFPRAHLVHVQRDPRDVAWSVWSLQFSQLGWTFELEHIAHRIEQHRRVMAHWRELLGERLIELRYEALVAEPEHRLCALLAALGLPWSDAVLRHAQRPAMVRNTSQMQVREPVNAKSVGRWRRYADALMPILPRLSAIATGDDAVAPR